MKRDNDLLRKMLFEFEEQQDWLIVVRNVMSMSTEDRTRLGHVKLLCDSGFVIEVGQSTFRLTNSGHDYLDAIRSDTIWEKTKTGAEKVGGMTLGMMRDLAIAYVKEEAAKQLGIEL